MPDPLSRTLDSSTEQQVRLYVAYLETIVDRLDIVGIELSIPERNSTWPFVRTVAMELRGVLEMLVFSGLLTHGELMNNAADTLRKADTQKARALVRSVNREWWPQPVRFAPSLRKGVLTRLVDRDPDTYLHEVEWGRAFGETSNLIHAQNPYSNRGMSLAQATQYVSDLYGKLVGLLTTHAINFGSTMWLVAIGAPSRSPRIEWRAAWVMPVNNDGAAESKG